MILNLLLEEEATASPVWAHVWRERGEAASGTAAGEQPASPATTERRWEVKSAGWRWRGARSASELVDGSQNMKQCRGNVWWVRCTELQAREQACWGNYSLMGSFGRQLPGVNVVWRDEVRLKWNFWLENVFKWKASMQTSCVVIGVGGWLGEAGLQRHIQVQPSFLAWNINIGLCSCA